MAAPVGEMKGMGCRNILVLDVGTSGLKAVLFNGDGRPLASHRLTYSVKASGERVEQDPSDWTDAVVECCRSMAGTELGVGAISLTCQRSSLVPVDGSGEPVRAAIMWQDTRSAPVVEALGERAVRVAELTGAQPNTVFLAPKMTWFRKADPEGFARTGRYCTIASYLLHFLTDRYVTDETYGARSLLMDLRGRRWEPELLELFDVDERMLCELASPGDVVGALTAEVAELTGLDEGIPVVTAGGDQQCGALGRGLVDDEVVTATFGTSACLLRLVNEVPADAAGLICSVHAMPGRYVLESSMPACGAWLDWLRRTLLPDGSIEDLEDLALESDPGAHGVVALPHLQGRGTPDWRSAARGAMLGLDLGASRSDIARAGYEAVLHETMNHLEALERVGGPVSALRVGGGVTRSPLFRQMLADGTGLTVLHASEPSDDGGMAYGEDTAFGAWMAAAVALGLCEDYVDAFSRSTVYLDRVMPDPSRRELYEEGRRRMNEGYGRLYGSNAAEGMGR